MFKCIEARIRGTNKKRVFCVESQTGKEAEEILRRTLETGQKSDRVYAGMLRGESYEQKPVPQNI